MTEPNTDSNDVYARVTVRVDRPGRQPVLTTFYRVQGFQLRTASSYTLDDIGPDGPRQPYYHGRPVLDFTITGRAVPEADPPGRVKTAEMLSPDRGWRVDLAQLQDWPNHATTRDGAPPVRVDDLVADMLTAHARIAAALAELDGVSYRMGDRVRAALTGR